MTLPPFEQGAAKTTVLAPWTTIVVSSMEPMEVERVGRASAAQFEDFYRIYATSIPAREKKDRSAMEALVADASYQAWVGRVDARIVGMAVYFAPPGDDFALLEYIAVDGDTRGRGLGGALFRSTLALVRRDQADRVVLLEVDSDRDQSAPDRVLRRRRKTFYRRFGCRVVMGCDYLFPLPGEGAPPIMDLMIHHVAASPAIPRAHLTRWLRTIYRDVYACSEADPRLARMVQTVSDPVTLEETNP